MLLSTKHKGDNNMKNPKKTSNSGLAAGMILLALLAICPPLGILVFFIIIFSVD
jgi:hypothetical protein